MMCCNERCSYVEVFARVPKTSLIRSHEEQILVPHYLFIKGGILGNKLIVYYSSMGVQVSSYIGFLIIEVGIEWLFVSLAPVQKHVNNS